MCVPACVWVVSLYVCLYVDLHVFVGVLCLWRGSHTCVCVEGLCVYVFVLCVGVLCVSCVYVFVWCMCMCVCA